MSYGKQKFYTGRPRRDLFASEIEGFRDEFLEQVDVNGRDECWLWTGFAVESQDGKHLGPRFRFGSKGNLSCARAMWALDHGVAPAEWNIRPSCGWDLCLNPDHLSHVEIDGETLQVGAREYFFGSIESQSRREQVRRMQYT